MTFDILLYEDRWQVRMTEKMKRRNLTNQDNTFRFYKYILYLFNDFKIVNDVTILKKMYVYIN